MIFREKDWHKYWMAYWKSRTATGNRYSQEEWNRFYAKELSLYFPEEKSRTLELGCGDGILFDHMSDNFATYIGSDCSPAMLLKFRTSKPNLNLVCADAVDIPLRSKKFDLVFSNGVCQFFDEARLKHNLQVIHTLLDSKGVYLIANIPDAQLRWFFYAGALRSDKKANRFHALIRMFVLKLSGGVDELGYWYSREYVKRLAEENGYICQTYSSASLEYRFHAVLHPAA